MKKVLRSLIHEKFPFELRLELELLSRKRNIHNKAKQDELFKLLRKYNITGIGELGQGTNRYAFKIGGYVVKVATDRDGKIDNFKEFKMAKRLYPHVAKTYEVSNNGTLLVAEYVQPFSSFAEMRYYEEPIKEILRKLSSVYLIGDVGISSKNYANWGLRVGREEPVCLDFAYVYNVSSSLFLCRNCNTGSMLVPNGDFNLLICQNPRCGQKYTFEDIRRRIGNDVHNHEIGDLSLEGYKLYESHVETELDESRSNYLARKEKPKLIVPETEIIEPIDDNFILDDEQNIYCVPNIQKTEDKIMPANFINMSREAAGELAKRMDLKDAFVIQAVARKPKVEKDEEEPNPMQLYLPLENENEEESEQEEIETEVEEEEEQEETMLAFSGDIGINNSNDEEPEEVGDSSDFAQEEITDPEEEVQSNEPTFAFDDETVEEKGEEKMEELEEVQKEVSEPSPINQKFRNNLLGVISNFSNNLGSWLYHIDAFETVKEYLVDNDMYPKAFYDLVQNAVFRSLISFLGFKECHETIKTQGRPKDRRYFVPPVVFSPNVSSTLKFFENCWKDNLMYTKLPDPADLLNLYAQNFPGEFIGIQEEWIEEFKKRLNTKLAIEIDGRDLLADKIKETWCYNSALIIDDPDLNDKASTDIKEDEDSLIVKFDRKKFEVSILEDGKFKSATDSDIDIDETFIESFIKNRIIPFMFPKKDEIEIKEETPAKETTKSDGILSDEEALKAAITALNGGDEKSEPVKIKDENPFNEPADEHAMLKVVRRK